MQEIGIGTKESIFFQSVMLFAERGYENVSVKNIASAAGIKPSSIYNHYEGKEAILDSIYQFYCDNCNAGRYSVEESGPILLTGSADEIMQMFNYAVTDTMPVMFDIVRILWGRIYVDEKAKWVYHHYVVNDSVEYITSILRHGRELGRVKMDDGEISTLAYILTGVRVFAANSAVSDPHMERWRAKELEMYGALSHLLKLELPQSSVNTDAS